MKTIETCWPIGMPLVRDRIKINFTDSEERDASDAVQNDEGIAFLPIPEELCTADGASQPSESVKVIFIQSLRSLGKKLWEMRSSFPGGIARVIFTMKGNYVVLLNGFIKKTQKAPQNEIALALKRAKDLEG